MKTGVELIAEERIRQLKELGYTLEHDEKWCKDDKLAKAAACYAGAPTLGNEYRTGLIPPKLWPFSGDAWKPTPDDRVRELTKAGALIAAEIDRLQRKEETYKIGEVFKHSLAEAEYQLIGDLKSVALLNRKTGMLVSEAQKVKNSGTITEEEFEKICGPIHTSYLTKIEVQ